MERSFFRYILVHTWRGQAMLLALTAVGLPLIYMMLDLPKRIVNKALAGKDIPEAILGYDVDQISYLMVLSFALLALITANGVLKYYQNVYRGVIGERMLRRLRYDLFRQVLRFPLPQFKKMSAGEIIPMVTAETEPLGGFIGDSIGLPAFQGGLLLTYLFFIFVQDVWLGLAAIALYPPQLYLIPKLQRKVNQLGKKRVRMMRHVSDHIGDAVAGVAEIHANDTAHYERASLSNRLGRIYAIRVEIYNRKYFIKFLNNFLAQITPFFFYSVGGYFVIKGDLSLGALIAVLAAYKDLADPWKELLNWYQTKEDARVKYDQIVTQFEPPDMLPEELVENPPERVPGLEGPVAATALVYSEDGVSNEVDRVGFRVDAGEHVALVGAGRSGKEDVARLLARVVLPTGGRVAVGEHSLASAHEALTGRRIAYVTQNAHVFSGTLAHNLYYGLKHLPGREPVREGAAAAERERFVRDARLTANSAHDIHADWIDYESAGVADARELRQRAMEVLGLVGMSADVLVFGLESTAEPEERPALVAKVLEARGRMRDRLRTPELAPMVELFDRGRFHSNVSVAENILFGTPREPEFAVDRLAENKAVIALLRDVGLLDEFQRVGAEVAKLMVELFADVPPESEMFAEYSFISSDDLPEFQALLKRVGDKGKAALSPADRSLLVGLPFKLILRRHRLGVIDEAMQGRILAAREEFRRRFERAEEPVVEFFDPERFSPALSIQDNILFGRPAYDQANAQARVSALIREVVEEVGMHEELVQLGLDYDVGSAGGRLAFSQRQRLAIARALMKNGDLLVFNEATSGLDPATEARVLRGVLERARGRTVVWALGRADLARSFDRVLVFDDGRLVEEGRFAELEARGGHLSRLLAGG